MGRQVEPALPKFRPYHDKGVTLVAYAWPEESPSLAHSVEPDPGSCPVLNTLLRCDLVDGRALAVFTLRAVVDDPIYLSLSLAKLLDSNGFADPYEAAYLIVERAERDLARVIELINSGWSPEPSGATTHRTTARSRG